MDCCDRQPLRKAAEEVSQMQSELSKDLTVAGAKIRFDEQCKRVLSNKEILAWILKNATEEFAEFSLDQIERCIEENPEVAAVGADPGETNRKIMGINTEDRVPGESCVTFDIRFLTFIPRMVQRIKLIINVEAQQKFYPGYDLTTRGVFYGGRMLSAQKGVEFTGDNYDGLKKVYSIWICMDTPDHIGNAMAKYEIKKTDIWEGFPDKKESYDKMTVVMIGLNEKKKSPNVQ